jgi:hypothetical protein
MDFYDVLAKVIELLQREGRASYRALKRQFDLNEQYIEDLKEELLFSHPVVDEEGRGLVWTGETGPQPKSASEPPAQQEVNQQGGWGGELILLINCPTPQQSHPAASQSPRPNYRRPSGRQKRAAPLSQRGL